MPRKPRQQTHIPGFGFIYRPRYTYKGKLQTSTVWWMEYNTIDGPVRRSTKQRDTAAAYSELAKAHGRRYSGEIQESAPERVRIGQLLDLLVDSYTNKATMYDLKCRVEKHIRPRFGDTRAIELRKKSLEDWVSYLRRQKLSNASINRCLANLHKALKLGEEEDPPLVIRIPAFPWQDESGNERQGIITPEMYRAIRDELAPHAMLAFVIGYHVGLRRGAILSLRWDWVDLQSGVIRIPHSGAGNKRKPRLVPIYGEMRAYLEMSRDQRNAEHPNCQWVIAYNGEHVGDIKTAWIAASRRLKLLGVLFHDLRRTAATNMDAAGIPRPDIKAICGWKTDRMFERYRIGQEKQAQAVGERMEAYLVQEQVKESKRNASVKHQ